MIWWKTTDFDNKQALIDELLQIKQKVQKKLNGLTTRDYDLFLDRICFASNDGSQNTSVYQPTLDVLELKKDKDTDYVLSLKSKGVINSKLKPLYTAFLNRIKPSEYGIGINFAKDSLAVK